MNARALREAYDAAVPSMTRHEAIASILDAAIRDGNLALGSRLPTVRSLSTQLGVSASTVVAAYNVLRTRGQISGEVGRGTFVLAPSAAPTAEVQAPAWTPSPSQRPPWRRRTVLTSANRLHTLHPQALDCSRGKPDSSLLLTEIIQRSFRRASEGLEAEALQYASPHPLPALRDALLPRLIRDKIAVEGAEMVIGTSAQQLMVLSLMVAARLRPDRPRVVAVEEPGYQTVFDALEYIGFRLIGMTTDEHGATPESLDAALGAGAIAALFTPSALNPKGVSWTRQRRLELTEVLEAHPQAVAIEDDQFADLAVTRPGSLIEGRTVGNRAIYIRTFAKSIAPDFRVAMALARPRLANLLGEAKSFSDGWTSMISQRALAYALADPGLDPALAHARNTYQKRRQAIRRILDDRLAGSGTRISGTDGLNLWIQLPPGVAATEVVDRAGALGVLLVSGEPFYIRPGRNDVIRMSISGITDDQVELAAERVAEAIRSSADQLPQTIPV